MTAKQKFKIMSAIFHKHQMNKKAPEETFGNILMS